MPICVTPTTHLPALPQSAPPLAYTPSLNLTHYPLHHNSPCHTPTLSIPTHHMFTWLTQTCLAINLHVLHELTGPHGYQHTPPHTYSPSANAPCPHTYLPCPNLPHDTPTYFAPTCTTTCLIPPYEFAWPRAHTPRPAKHHMPMHFIQPYTITCLPASFQPAPPHTYPLHPNLSNHMSPHLIPTCSTTYSPFCPNQPCHTPIPANPSQPPHTYAPRQNPVLFNLLSWPLPSPLHDHQPCPNMPTHMDTQLSPTCTAT